MTRNTISYSDLVNDDLADASTEVTPAKSSAIDTRFDSTIVLLVGILIGRFAETVIRRSLDGMAGACADTFTKVPVRVVVGKIDFGDNLGAPEPGDARPWCWDRNRFDIDVSVVERAGVIFSVWIEVLDCTIIGLAPDTDMSADADISMWATVTSVLEFRTSSSALEY